MKKLFALLLCAALLCGGMTVALADGTYKCGAFEYALREDGSAELIRYTHSSEYTGCLVIPNQLDGHPIMAVRYNPFQYDCKFTVSVPPDHPYLATINGVLFGKSDKKLIYYPKALTDAAYTIPSGIKTIGDYAFYGCSSLTSVTIPSSVTITGDPFPDGTKIEYSDVEYGDAPTDWLNW